MDNELLTYIPEPEHHELLEPPKPRPKPRKLLILGCAAIFSVIVAFLIHLRAPSGFPTDTIINVESGETLSGITHTLSDNHSIRSDFWFKAFSVLFGGTRGLVAGDYYLKAPQSTITLAWRFSHGLYELENIKITIPEGLNSTEIAALFLKNKKFTHFNSKEFIKIAAPYEGYLFPDTYLFLPNITAQNVVDAMLATYQKRVEALSADITAFKRPIKDIIKMASIVEVEARTEETRRTIAGILWKRLDQGIPLQVDAAFAFVNGKKDSKELTTSDLRIDSPYNTYVHKGLPPGPISNPGLDAIYAVIHPIKTKYYFYLSDDQGTMHYAVTNAEHEVNKAKYLQ